MPEPVADLEILFLTHRAPYPPDKGDRIRAYHLLHHLNRFGSVRLGSLNDEPLSARFDQELARLTHERCIVALNRSRWLRAIGSLACGRSATEGLFASRILARTVRDWHQTKPFDVAIVYCSSMFPYAHPLGIDILFDCVDVDSAKLASYADEAGHAKRWLYRLEQNRLEQLEAYAAEQSRVVLLTTEEEADLFRKVHAVDNVMAMTNGVDADFFKPLAAEPIPQSLVFVGVMDYPPNVDAVCWFAEQVWPRLRERFPQVHFAIVGRDPSERVMRLGSVEGIKVLGAVDDVRPYVAQSMAAIAPLRIARGIQNKVLEAMAMGKPVVVSPEAVGGLHVTPGEHLVVAESPSDWLEALAGLFAEGAKRERMGAAARDFVLKHHCWGSTLSPLSKLLEEIARQKSRQTS